MASHIGGIDHAIIGVRDLEQARVTFERLGFCPTPRGRHLGQDGGHGAGDHCLMFADGYVELRGIVDPAVHDQSLAQFLAAGEGLFALALGSTDPEATGAAWRAAGLAPATVADCGRVIEPDLELRCRDVSLAVEATGGVPLYACAHVDPGALRRPEWLAHPNGAIAIGSITAVVDEPAALYEPMAKVFGTTCLTETDDTLAVHTGRGVLLFVTPDDLDMLHPEVEALAGGDRPTLAALTLLVRDLAATAALLDRQDVAYRRDVAGAIGISPEHSHGVMLEFAAA